jgi:hypothetical protein
LAVFIELPLADDEKRKRAFESEVINTSTYKRLSRANSRGAHTERSTPQRLPARESLLGQEDSSAISTNALAISAQRKSLSQNAPQENQTTCTNMNRWPRKTRDVPPIATPGPSMNEQRGG